MIIVPEAFTQAAVARAGDAGRMWAEQLPQQVAALCSQWHVVQDGLPMHGHLGLVIPVRQRATPLVLKISWPDELPAQEAQALAAWNGHGAVRLVAAQPEHGALLLERLDHTQTLETCHLDEAVVTAGALLRRLAIAPPTGLPLLSTLAERLAFNMPQWWKQLGRPIPQRMLEMACSFASEYGSFSEHLLVHADLHYGNVLAGAREPWLAIDPKPIAGCVEFGVAPLLWRRFDELNTMHDLRRRFDMLVDAAALDPQRTQAWTLVRTVDYWLWSVRVGFTHDPAMCETLVEWLYE